MDQINMHEAIDHDRRRFFGAAALTFTAAELGVIGAAQAETKSASPPVIKPGANTSFAPLKQVDAGVLNIGYAEAGPPNGSPVFLLHGWPYDIHDSSKLRQSSPRRATASSSRICADTDPPAFATPPRPAPVSKQRSA
jgi:hypothetical protein